MMDGDHLGSERHSFSVRADRDYSGLTIQGTSASGAQIARSFFNGANLLDVDFHDCDISNTELTEVRETGCTFVGCNLGGSDFIDSRFEDSSFVDCDFTNGEWRESSFVRCRFERCRFDHTTVTLSEFCECTLDGTSLQSVDNRAFHYNVFSKCDFPQLELTGSLTSRNFGLPATGGDREPAGVRRATISLEELCHLNNVGRFQVVDLADAVRGLTGTIEASGSRRNSALAFFGRIIRVLTVERRISATSLFYIEAELSALASATDDQEVLLAAMGAMIEARTALLRIVAECEDEEPPRESCRAITIHFSPTYPRTHADALTETISAVAGADAPLEIKDFKNGSTWIEIISVGAVATTTILSTLNVVLRQATITVKRIGEVRRELRKLSKQRPLRRSKSLALAQTKVPAILSPESASPQLAAAKSAVRRHGRVLVELDEPASVTLFVEPVQLR
jgi:uncharacterized protein YjbI with pentapeptide repeats